MIESGDYISRKAICLTDFEIAMCNGDYKELCKMILDKIANAPAADVRPMRRGRWEDVKVRDYSTNINGGLPLSIASMFCPVCGRWHNEVYQYGNPTEMAHYCPNCGADMRGES